MKKIHQNVAIKTLPHSEIEIIGEVGKEALDEAFDKAITDKVGEVEMPGFRKGKAPRDIVLREFGGNDYFLDKASEDLLNQAYQSIVEENSLRVIGRPKVTITKLAKGNPLGFTIVTAIIPEVKLPDYKKIAREIMPQDGDTSVTDKEIEDVILEVRKHHAHMEMHRDGKLTDHNHAPVEEKDLPPLTDELATKMGDFKDMADLRSKLKENLAKEKEIRAKDKKRSEVVEKIIEKMDVDVPQVLIDNELDTMFAQFEGDITRAGGTMDDYLKTIKKSAEEVRKEWHETAVKKAKAQLAISTISIQEKITPDADKVRAESEKILTIYPEADPIRARSYVAMMLTNEEVFKFLENQK